MHFIKIIFTAALTCAAVYSFAQDSSSIRSDVYCDPLVVTASGYRQPVSEKGKNISVISEEDIRNSGKQFLPEILETVPGAVVNWTGSRGSVANIYLRGGRTGSVLVMIDGVRVKDPMSTGGSVDISDIPLYNVERIEIVRGAMSSLYGSDAALGVINIITKKKQDNNLVLSGEGGSHGTYRGTVSVADSAEKFSCLFSASRYGTSGVSSADVKSGDRDGFLSDSASGRISAEPWTGALLDLSMTYRDSDLKTDDGALEDDVNRKYARNMFTAAGSLVQKAGDNFSFKAAGSWMSYTRHDTDPADSADIYENDIYLYKGGILSCSLSGAFILPELSRTDLGVEISGEKGSSVSSYFSDWSVPAGFTNEIFEEKKVITESVFLHEAVSLKKMLFISGGVRMDSHPEYGRHFSWDSSMSVIPVKGTDLRVSAGTGFRAPTLYELYSAYGNMDLSPEKTFVLDCGINQQFFDGDLVLDFTVFHQIYDSMIDFGWSRYENAEGKMRNSGAETSVCLKPLGWLRLDCGYTYLKFRDEDSALSLRRPKHRFTAAASVFPSESLNFSVSYRYAGNRTDSFYNSETWTSERKRLGSVQKLDLSVSWQAADFAEIRLHCENILDAEDQEVYGYTPAGRTFYAGADVKL